MQTPAAVNKDVYSGLERAPKLCEQYQGLVIWQWTFLHLLCKGRYRRVDLIIHQRSVIELSMCLLLSLFLTVFGSGKLIHII